MGRQHDREANAWDHMPQNGKGSKPRDILGGERKAFHKRTPFKKAGGMTECYEAWKGCCKKIKLHGLTYRGWLTSTEPTIVEHRKIWVSTHK